MPEMQKNLEYLLLEINHNFKITLLVATHSIDLANKMDIRMKLDNGILTPFNK